ncbi:MULTISPECIES: chromosome segregation protein SMC [unclassified Corynebacterium]|uniref:chromosome segregation protein SMC n=1 Tax=unclassified Corynebacterium TaxID=2624378 RepID=UPI001EF72F81|nr:MULTISPECIES: chromosome segregation protein SMC [unclassified Corynebacterium]MCG7258042.1 chromosome segregation protein SMC [Corynebacterium sp. ACRQK]MCG7262475.1 chromosome segregation protein SMC [Corynebacterium sp. ACRQL]
MHLKSLTLKGFKSFASATTLKLEPGICAVVGPNGSGKSNVVDALAWVMGEQGAKTLRGGKMEDVIFAGTGDRKPLGRAEVTLTIDNSDGKLPIEYSEVSITRRMFRDGASEYEINGAKARLMDIQELLSDSGIGREMHVIVGQGRLSQILESRPEERRAFIEEAAGVLKHRRRKEKAQRKLVNMQANLDRLHDLTDELRKQLGPLARQAEAAQKASAVQATIRSTRVQLAAHKVKQLSEELNDSTRRSEMLAEQRAELQAELEEHSETLAVTEEELRTALEEAEAAKNLWYRLSAVQEKNSATLRIATDRADQAQVAEWSGPDPQELLERAERAAEEQAELEENVEIAAEKLETIAEQVAEAEEAARAAEQEHFAQVRAIADRREGVVRLLAQHEAAATQRDNAAAEVERLQENAAEQQETLDGLMEDITEAEEALRETEASGGDLEETRTQADREAAGAEERAEQLRAEQLQLERDIATAEATIAAWQDRLTPTDGAAVVVRAADKEDIATRRLAEQLHIHDGWGAAAAAVLGDAASSGIVAPLSDALISALTDAREGRAVLLDPGAPEGDTSATFRLDTDVSAGKWLLDLMDVPADLLRPLTALLVDVVAVGSAAEARKVVAADPRLRAVTKEGSVYGAGWVASGSGGTTPVELADKIAAETEGVTKKKKELGDLQAALSGALDAASDLRTAAAAARAAEQEHRALRDAAAKRLSALQKQGEAAQRQLERSTAEQQSAEQRLAKATEELDELADRVARVDDEEHTTEPSSAERDAAALHLSQVKAMEMEARLAQRTAEERAQSTRGRAENLRRQARAEEAARKHHQQQQARRAAAREMATCVREQAQRIAERIADALATAEANRSHTEQAHKQWQSTMAQQRDKVSALTAHLGRMNDNAHSAELARTQAQVKIEQAVAGAMEQLGLTAEQLLAEELPEDFDAAATKAELKKAEKALNSLGKVNPLALEEFKALEERYNFLAQQLDDVERARNDLHEVIADVDATILQLFTEAWQDVEVAFPQVFSTLFPGGAGRLVLTDPDDMLTTGIEVEARPPGKKVKRLSLLSGGEKSLTALAMLVAIFKARPSPFYVMDEVEAALDDVNLRRLLALFEELRKDSQLIVITHQKPTMDVANVLYGVTMRGDGVTRVISQRMAPEKTA